ncbi:hypothetical protein BDV37DRAFT_244353 [Aspergillus pseudonomiae]|uniref:F-box domain-containing protein n=1 Tax=Aspergillus pseudonomiae TaxID=1506151 RepID=A0A5N7DII9_9EURO|nr:uncharacterized protein BDV37DRAFT_244353 [Aspergillus pseudonomiae]KAE8405939.1 hypothetical protein BDV37DRAFT_244353 [Aspergillus pseudonomiae]
MGIRNLDNKSNMTNILSNYTGLINLPLELLIYVIDFMRKVDSLLPLSSVSGLFY